MQCMPSYGVPHELGWHEFDSGLAGTPISLDDLKRMFPEDETHSEVRVLSEADSGDAPLGNGYKVLGQRRKETYSRKLAYRCNECETIYLGEPQRQSLTGKQSGYQALCEESHLMRQIIWGFSCP